ncbi:protein translocase subunit SecA [Methylocaldum marinum]|uniref:Protein translocase subunit SecA n=1 Tax=Methylocaldum marinum TaxID=1432792 RepID=A0A286P3R4_9GAMM|nr:protein translocase subunit SecA [Methylocaldum marinum]
MQRQFVAGRNSDAAAGSEKSLQLGARHDLSIDTGGKFMLESDHHFLFRRRLGNKSCIRDTDRILP